MPLLVLSIEISRLVQSVDSKFGWLIPDRSPVATRLPRWVCAQNLDFRALGTGAGPWGGSVIERGRGQTSFLKVIYEQVLVVGYTTLGTQSEIYIYRDTWSACLSRGLQPINVVKRWTVPWVQSLSGAIMTPHSVSALEPQLKKPISSMIFPCAIVVTVEIQGFFELCDAP